MRELFDAGGKLSQLVLLGLLGLGEGGELELLKLFGGMMHFL